MRAWRLCIPLTGRCPGLPRNGTRPALYRSLRTEVMNLRRTFRFDVILGAFAYPDIVAAAQLAREAECPLVGLVMGSDMNDLAARPALRPQIQRAFTQAQYIIALSSSLKDRVVELGLPESRVVVQRNGVDGVRFSIQDAAAARSRLGLRSQSPHCMFHRKPGN